MGFTEHGLTRGLTRRDPHTHWRYLGFTSEVRPDAGLIDFQDCATNRLGLPTRTAVRSVHRMEALIAAPIEQAANT